MSLARLEDAGRAVVVAVVVNSADFLDQHVGESTAALGSEETFIVDRFTSLAVPDKVKVQVEMNTNQRRITYATRMNAFGELDLLVLIIIINPFSRAWEWWTYSRF